MTLQVSSALIMTVHLMKMSFVIGMLTMSRITLQGLHGNFLVLWTQSIEYPCDLTLKRLTFKRLTSLTCTKVEKMVGSLIPVLRRTIHSSDCVVVGTQTTLPIHELSRCIRMHFRWRCKVHACFMITCLGGYFSLP